MTKIKVQKSLYLEAFCSLILSLNLKVIRCPFFCSFGLESNCCTVDRKTAERAK